jgi:Uma2 family endonuclease
MITTLQEYLLISQTMLRVEHFQRYNDLMWLMREYTHPDQGINLTSVGCRMLLSDIYEKVSLPADDDKPPFGE